MSEKRVTREEAQALGWSFERMRRAVSPSYDKRYRARKAVAQAVLRGALVRPDCCSACGKQTGGFDLQGHHDDYDKPLDVRWLCRKCHGLHHRLQPKSRERYEERKARHTEIVRVPAGQCPEITQRGTRCSHRGNVPVVGTIAGVGKTLIGESCSFHHPKLLRECRESGIADARFVAPGELRKAS